MFLRSSAVYNRSHRAHFAVYNRSHREHFSSVNHNSHKFQPSAHRSIKSQISIFPHLLHPAIIKYQWKITINSFNLKFLRGQDLGGEYDNTTGTETMTKGF